MNKKKKELLQKAGKEFNKKAVEAQKRIGTIHLPVKAKASKNTRTAITFSYIIGVTALTVTVWNTVCHIKDHSTKMRRDWDVDRTIGDIRGEIRNLTSKANQQAEETVKKVDNTRKKVAKKATETVEKVAKTVTDATKSVEK